VAETVVVAVETVEAVTVEIVAAVIAMAEAAAEEAMMVETEVAAVASVTSHTCANPLDWRGLLSF